MNTSETAVAAGILGASYVTIGVIALVLVVLLIIARWKIFTKAGEAGWKSIIPVYADYIQWKIAWKKTSLFWIMLVLVIGGYIIAAATGTIRVTSHGNIVGTGNSNIFGLLGLILVLVGAILGLIATYKLFVSFGHGAGWFILYILFSSIMMLVLGFGSSRYLGPQD